jgi:hypothetical protein
MRKWFASLALACGCSLALVQAGSAQVVEVQREVQAQKAQAPAQAAKAIQIQVDAVQVQPVRVIMPGGGFGGPGYIGGNRLTMQADAVFAGRVVAIEPMDIEAPQVANGPKVTYRVAVVQLSESIFGLKKDAKQVRVGFVVGQGNVPPLNGPGGAIQILPAGGAQPAIQPFPPIQGGPGLRRPFPGGGFQQMNLTIGQDGLFTVNKHHKEEFYLSPTYQNFAAKENNPGFDAQVKTAKQLAKVMGDPVASLKSDDKETRYTAAAVLISRYRSPNNPTGQPMKQEQISAEESKLILKALGEGDWKQFNFGAPIPTAFELFGQLGVGPNDGYNPNNARTQQAIAEAMQKWLDENNGKYRIQRFVIDPNAKPGVQPLPGGIRPVPGVQIQPLPVQIQPVQDLPAPLPPQKQDK